MDYISQPGLLRSYHPLSKSTDGNIRFDAPNSGACLSVGVAIRNHAPEPWTVSGTQELIIYSKTFGPTPPRVTIAEDVRACNPAGPDEVTVQLAYANTTLAGFCTRKVNEKILGGPVEEIFSLGAGKELNISVSVLNDGCSSIEGQTLLDEYDCEYYLSECLNGCDTNSNTAKHGGSVDDGCFHYPVQPGITEGILSCEDPGLPALPNTNAGVEYAPDTGFDREEAIVYITDFCQNITKGYGDSRPIHPNENGTKLYYNPSKGNDVMKIQLTYNQDQSCPQTGDQAVYPADLSSCERFLLGRIIDDCNTNFQPPYGKFGGILTDACGLYAIQTENVEPIECGIRPRTTPVNMTEDTATAAIDEFCGLGYHLDPSVTLDPNAFYQSPPDGAAFDTYHFDANLVYMDATFGSLAENWGCQLEETRFAVEGDECKRRLHAIFDQCPSGGQMGAQQHEGCVLWKLYAYSGTAS